MVSSVVDTEKKRREDVFETFHGHIGSPTPSRRLYRGFVKGEIYLTDSKRVKVVKLAKRSVGEVRTQIYIVIPILLERKACPMRSSTEAS